jgi:nucleoside-diphosphate-sugar epimerase
MRAGRTVLVTGASGFVGRAVVPLLVDASYEVQAVHHAGSKPSVRGVGAHRVDLTDGVATKALVDSLRPSHLVHLAWYTTPGLYWSSDRNRDWLAASVSLLHAFAAAGGRRAVLVGTCAEYDWRDGVCSETTTPRRPDTLYGTCKNKLYELSTAHAASAGYSAAWARLFFPYGPGEASERLVPTVVRGVLEGRPVELSHGHQRRDFVFVEDIAAALVRLLESEEVEGAVNIGSGTATSLRELVTTIVERAALPADVRFGARAAGDGGPPLIVADTARMRGELGWEPAITLGEGIDKTISWWRRRLTQGGT